MQLTLAAIIAFATVLVDAQFCPEAMRFGVLNVSPTTVVAGDNLTVNANFTCAINTFGIIPEYTDYYIEVPVNNSGYEPPILLARRTFAPGNTLDLFTVQVPDAYYYADTSYAVMLYITYPVGSPHAPYSIVGATDAAITINV